MKRIKLPHINWFEMVYLAIAAATFQHTMWAAATVFEGPMPIEFQSPDWWRWHLNGGLIAVAIDVGMLVAARELRKKTTLVMAGAFISAAIATFYTQVLFSLNHTQAMILGSGVSEYWSGFLDPIVQARVILVPLMLPLFATIFTLTSIKQEEIIQHEEEVAEEAIRVAEASKLPFEFETARKTLYFATETERDEYAADYLKRREKAKARRERKKNQQNQGQKKSPRSVPVIQPGIINPSGEENYQMKNGKAHE